MAVKSIVVYESLGLGATGDSSLETATPTITTVHRKRWKLSADTIIATYKAEQRDSLAIKFGLGPKTPVRKFGVRTW